MAGKRRKHPKVLLQWLKRWQGELQYARLRWMVPGSGKYEYKPLGYLTTQDAEEKRADQESALRLGVQLVDDSPKLWSVAVVIGEYLDELETRLGEDHRYLANETKRLVAVEDHLGSVIVDHVTAKRLQHYAAARAKEHTRLRDRSSTDPEARQLVRKSSIREEIAAYRRAHRSNVELGNITTPVPSVPNLAFLPDDMRPARRLLEGDVAAIIATGHRDVVAGMGSLLQVLAWSGRRPIAVFSLRRRDCLRLLDEDLPRKHQLVYWERDKGGRALGWGPVTEPAKLAIVHRLGQMNEQEDPDALLWKTATGQQWTDVLFNRPFHRVAGRAKVKNVEPYDLRRFACTRILEHVVSPKKALPFTGHRTVQTLFRYVYAEEGAAEEAAGGITWTPAPLRLVDDGDQG